MKYNYRGTNYEIPDTEVDHLVDTLEISIADACELWLTDNGKATNEEQEKVNKQAATAPRRYEQGATPRKKVKKERKIDQDKAEMLRLIQKAFENHPDIIITGQKTETELYFEYNDVKYTVKLTKHRPKK